MIILRENIFSESLPNSLLDDTNFKRLFNKNNKDPIIETKPDGASKFKFRVKNHCGHIKIGKQHYFIEPKMGSNFLTTMLMAHQTKRFNQFNNRLGQNNSKNHFDELIAHLFIGCYENTLKNKLRLGYISETVKSFKSQGTLNIAGSMEFITYGEKSPAWNKTTWSPNTKVNKAVRYLFAHLRTKLNLSFKTQNTLTKIADEVASEPYTGYVNFKELVGSLDRLHTHYKPILSLGEKLNLNGHISAGSQDSYSLLIPTWELFEGACQNIIKQKFTEYQINDKINSYTKRPCLQTNNMLKPDIILTQSNQVKILGDCKNKVNPELKLKRDDMYQVNAYMDAYNVQETFIFYPSTAEKYKYETYKLTWGHKIYVVTLPTDNYTQFKNSIEVFISDFLNCRTTIAS